MKVLALRVEIDRLTSVFDTPGVISAQGSENSVSSLISDGGARGIPVLLSSTLSYADILDNSSSVVSFDILISGNLKIFVKCKAQENYGCSLCNYLGNKKDYL